MEVVSVFGLIFAIASLGECAARLATGAQEEEGAPTIALSLDLPQLTKEVLTGIDVKTVEEEGKLNFIRKKVVHLLQETYMKHLNKQQIQKEQDTGQEIQELLSKADNGSLAEAVVSRKRRQVVNVPIPTLQGYVPGADDKRVDTCERDEVLLEDGECQQLLTQGPCDEDELILMDTKTRKGYCAPRLCGPDRVFLFSDQQCHDPREKNLCPPGRQLFTTSFGTPVCGCPDGTYEEDDDLDDDVCEPILGKISDCPSGEVFWFSDFRLPPECRPDPCKDMNLKRGPKDLPYVPSYLDGICYQVGTRPPFCSPDQFYSLSLELLRGVCASLEDAGYLVLDSDELEYFVKTYGNPLPKEGAAKPYKPSKTKITPAGTTLLRWPELGAPVMRAPDHEEPPAFYIGQSVMSKHHPAHNELDEDFVSLFPTHMNAFSPPYITVNGSLTLLGFTGGVMSYVAHPRHHRERRAPLPFASPANVVEPGLSACRAGARRDGNAKCRGTILPSSYPPSRSRRDVPPVPPSPACPPGTLRDVKRGCSSSSSGIASSINAIGLG
ncbi:uncharacterized protein [Panulirus ornatus]